LLIWRETSFDNRSYRNKCHGYADNKGIYEGRKEMTILLNLSNIQAYLNPQAEGLKIYMSSGKG